MPKKDIIKGLKEATAWARGETALPVRLPGQKKSTRLTRKEFENASDPHSGSTLDNFLIEEGIRDDVDRTAKQRVSDQKHPRRR